MSNATSDPADWSNFSHRAAFVSHPPHPYFLPTSVSADATVVTTVPTGSGSGGSISERHAGKAPPRKRPRSNRRAPTTLLNTDTTNFRAMVQQFTGVSTGPLSTSYGTVGQSAINFGMGTENRIQQPPATRLGHQQQQKRYEYRPPQQQQQPPQEMMRFASMAGNGLEEGEEMIMQGFFFDGMAGAGQHVIPGQMEREGGGGYY